MQRRLAQVAVGLSTRQLSKRNLRADDTGFAIVAPEDSEKSDMQQPVIAAEEVWFNKHNKGREAVRIVRITDKREIENQRRLFYKNPNSNKGNAKVQTHLPIITQETARNLGYVAAIPTADLILYNIHKELIGACTSEDSISSRVLEVEASWMTDTQFVLKREAIQGRCVRASQVDYRG